MIYAPIIKSDDDKVRPWSISASPMIPAVYIMLVIFTKYEFESGVCPALSSDFIPVRTGEIVSPHAR